MKIYKKEVSEDFLNKIIERVRRGKYSEIGEEIVRKEVVKYLTNKPYIIERLEKKRYFDDVVKKVRGVLYKGIGSFNEKEGFEDHRSTQERDYSVYSQIFEITGEVGSIVDLGCGVNGLSYDKLKGNPRYIGYDINEKYVEMVNDFFERNKINGKAYCRDVTSMEEFPEADMYFLFKFLDSIEKGRSHKLSESIIKKINAKYIVVSFSTKTFSGKDMNVPRRRWFELMIERLDYDFKVVKTENEMFYVVFGC